MKLKVRTGDKVVIIAGKDKGQIGTIAAISPYEGKAIVLAENPENPEVPLPLNAAVKHRKARYQGERSARIRIPVPIDISNLMVIDPASDKPSRVGRRLEDGKIVRYAKKSGKTIVDKPNIVKES
ncbi:MAG: 50S ribosomal protein L24 [Armatimonadetes bacterium]|nr:50S ribosomal protein L24 [Armatimonadota bacterium]